MSDIPYSVRGGSVTSVNKLRGLNFDTIEDNEMFKKVDANNVGGTKLISSKTAGSNVLRMFVDNGPFEVLGGFIEAETVGGVQKLHLNNTGEKEDGITITSSKRVGIGITNPGENLEVDGSIQIDSANVARFKFEHSGPSPHALGEIDGEEDGTNGGDLQFYTKEDGGSVTEKLRINNIGAIGIGGANYGNTGQVLTSNGSGAAPTWETPYFISFRLSSTFVWDSTTNENNLFVTVNNWTVPSGLGNPSDLINNTNWRCPRSGVYRMDGTCVLYRRDADRVVIVRARIRSSSKIYSEVVLDVGYDATDFFKLATLNFNIIDNFVLNEEIYMEVRLYRFPGGTQSELSGDPKSIWNIQRLQ